MKLVLTLPHRSRSVAVYRRKSSSKIATKASQQGSKFRSPNDAVTTYLNYGTVDDSVDIGLHPNGYVGNGNDDVGCDSNSQSDQETEPLLDSEEEEETVITQTGPINREDATNGKTRRENEQTQHGDGSVEAGKAGGENEVDSTAVLKSFVLMLALSLHTVFDGLVIGLQESERDVWTLLAAIGLHKTLIAVSISLSLLVSHRSHPRATLVYLFLFSLVAPLGVLIGTVLTETDFDEHAQGLTSGVLQSVATGTFMYVTFVESLKDRFESSERLLNVLLVLVGFGCVCALRVLLPS
ncbi:hypothetical protein BaRGS_00011882 [Batillaria attramentaria]|uniref:Uncharacterized protein n=1 Tax=Batillaria attramentaria TaxID=370345 RepID=A0ABD0LD64_9CAEN